MNLAQLQAWFAANKVAVLGVGAAGAVLLGLRARNKSSSSGTGAAVTPGTAAAVVPATGLQTTGSTYDSSAYDVYSALQSELAPFLQAQAAQTNGSSGITSVPPIASTLFNPNRTGQYVSYTGGGIYEAETDGSLYHLSLPEWQQIIAANGGKEPTTTVLSGTAATDYGSAQNLQAKINNAAGV